MKDRPSSKELIDEIRRFSEEGGFSEKQINKICGYTGEELHYEDWLTGEKKKYALHQEEKICEEKCPIDGTSLVDVKGFRFMEYMCPNCNNYFSDLSEEGLHNRYQELIKEYKDLFEIKNEERNNLLKIIKRLEKK